MKFGIEGKVVDDGVECLKRIKGFLNKGNSYICVCSNSELG